MAGGLNEEQAAMNTGILNVTLTLRGEFLAKVCGVLVLDILDNGVPARSRGQYIYAMNAAKMYMMGFDSPSVVVHLVTITGCVDDVQAKTNAILLND